MKTYVLFSFLSITFNSIFNIYIVKSVELIYLMIGNEFFIFFGISDYILSELIHLFFL